MKNKRLNFSGRIIQLIEALDYGDAVSNAVLAYHDILNNILNIPSEIYVAHSHELVRHYVKPISDLIVNESDILIYHYSFFAEQTLKLIPSLKCTKILVYQNITPSTYFVPGSQMHYFSETSRAQLNWLVKHFDIVSGPSQYNLDELIALGVDRSRSFILPILVEPLRERPQTIKPLKNKITQWLFVGRIACNKRQDLLIEVFSDYCKQYGKNHRLVLAGKAEDNDPYVIKVKSLISHLNLEDSVLLTGKISDEEVKDLYRKADIFVCLSEHEGFGVPAVEAAHYKIPVVAVANTAVTEVLAGYPGLVKTSEEVINKIHSILSNDETRSETIEKQLSCIDRYRMESVTNALIELIKKTLPSPDEYKTVSVVICTYNRADLLDRCLDYLRYQTCQQFEVIVVNGPSTDHTEAVIEKYQHLIKVARNPERNLSISRNIGIELSSGDIVAFIDDDALPYDDWIGLLLKYYNALPRRIAGMGGPTFFAGSLEFQQQAHFIDSDNTFVDGSDLKKVQSPNWFRGLLGTNATFKRKILLEIDGFDEQYDYFLDETDLCVRIQQKEYLIHYEKELYLRHEFAQSPNRLSKYNFNWPTIVKNHIYFVKKFNESRNALVTLYKLIIYLYKNRFKYFLNGWMNKEISQKEFLQYSKMVFQGIGLGFRDAKKPRKCRTLNASDKPVLIFPTSHHYPMCGREIKRFHIVIITTEFARFTHNGGIGTMFYMLASELLQMGHFVSVITPGAQNETYVRGRFSLYRTPVQPYYQSNPEINAFSHNMNWSMSVAKKLQEIQRDHSVDIIESALWNVEAYIASRFKLSIPVIVRLVTPFKIVDETNNLQTSLLDKSLWMEAEKDLINRADCVIPISLSIEKSIQKEYGVKKDTRWHQQPIGIAYWPQFEVTSDYASMSTVDARLSKLPKNSFKYLFLGRLEKRKGIDLFLEAAAKVLKSNQEAYFIIAGKGREEWQHYINEKNINKTKDNIIFLGEIDQGNKDKLYSFCDVVVFPSRYESFGLVALEAFVHGKPVIACNAASIPEVVIENECGLLFAPENHEALASQMIHLQNDAKLYQQLSKGARNRAYELSSRNMAINSISLYSKLIEAK